uniref:Uncharacterized protein n=1 Tax=Rhizophora mucronata TaxID=61149 RepID=A0A2P2PZX7_RHIMU
MNIHKKRVFVLAFYKFKTLYCAACIAT